MNIMKMTRRQWVGVLVGAVAIVTVWGTGWGAEKGPVRVGFISPLSGPFAQNGIDMLEGFRLAFEDAGTQAGGRKIEVLSEDSWVEPAEALTKLRKLVEKDQVHVAAGGLLAPTTYALQAFVRTQRVPFLVPVSCADDASQRRIEKWYVRIGYACSQVAHPFGEYAYKVLGYRRIATVAFDFAYGYESAGGFQRVFEDQGGQIIQKLWVPANVQDFAPYMSQIRRDADAVYAVFSGSASIRFVKAYQDYGLRGRIPLLGIGTLTEEHILPAMGDEALGIITAQNYSAALTTAENRRFAQKFQARANKSASLFSAFSYAAGRTIVEAIKAAGGDVEDKEKFLVSLKSVELRDDPRGPTRLDQWGNSDQNIYVRKVERVEARLQNSVMHTFPNVSQFWTYKPEEFLKNPVYDRDKYPGCRFCQ